MSRKQLLDFMSRWIYRLKEGHHIDLLIEEFETVLHREENDSYMNLDLALRVDMAICDFEITPYENHTLDKYEALVDTIREIVQDEGVETNG